MTTANRNILTIAGTAVAVIAIGFGASAILSASAGAAEPLGQPINVAQSAATLTPEQSSVGGNDSAATAEGAHSRDEHPEAVAPDVRDLDGDGDVLGDRDRDGDGGGHDGGVSIDDDGAVHLHDLDDGNHQDKSD
jgi:hypothetical protein